jgi:hypothetical protein
MRSAFRVVSPAPNSGIGRPIDSIRTESLLTAVSVAGKRDSEGRDSPAENACWSSFVSAETAARALEPANWLLFATR